MKQAKIFGFSTIIHLCLAGYLLGVFFLVRTSPLLGSLGFESANLLVICAGPLFCLVSALQQKRHFLPILMKELLWFLVLIASMACLLFLNGYYVASCSLGAGIFPFLVVGVPPLLINVSVGSLIAAIFNRRVVKALIVMVGYLGYYAFIIFCFYREISFRVLTHASFLMTSDLLEGDQLSPAVIGYRTSTLILAVVIVLIGINFINNKKTQMFLRNATRPIASLTVIIVLLLIHFLLDHESKKALGKNRHDLVRDYQLLAQHNNLFVFADPLKTSTKNAKIVLDEARFYQARIEKRLGKLENQPITIWLHATDEDKFLYTGAKHVHFALPKLREIHVAGYGFPHSVLGHELAHIDIGDFSETLYGVPGPHYLVPNLALTEGIAVAVTKELYIEHDLTLLEQARAFHQAGIQVNVEELFSDNPLHFMRVNPRISYTYAGALIEFLLGEFKKAERIDKLQSLIKGGSLAALYSHDGSELSLHLAKFRENLKEPGRKDALLWAKQNFTGESILLADCSSRAQQDIDTLNRALLNQDFDAYRRHLEKFPTQKQTALLTHAIDDALFNLHFGLADALAELKKPLVETKEAQKQALLFKQLEALVGKGELFRAREVLQHIDDDYFLPSQRRLLTILRLLPKENTRLMEFLFRSPLDSDVRLARLSSFFGQEEALRRPENKVAYLMAGYLLARFYLRQKQPQDAQPLIREVLNNIGHVPENIARESLFIQASIDTELHAFDEARLCLDQLLATGNSNGEKQVIKDKKARLLFLQEHRDD